MQGLMLVRTKHKLPGIAVQEDDTLTVRPTCLCLGTNRVHHHPGHA